MSSTAPRLTHYRSTDVAAVLDVLAAGQSVAVVGLSNFGKSTLLRQMIEPPVADAYEDLTGRPSLFVFVDCNRMLEMSAQGLYETILRAVLERLADGGSASAHSHLVTALEALYAKVVESRSTFAIPLAFNDAIITVLDDAAQIDVILLLDEFDDVLTSLDERVFLNFRALKDKYTHRLNYVTATLRPPSTVGGGDNLSEFLEVFTHKVHLKPLGSADAVEMAAELFEQANDHLDHWESEFILAQAGGHPGLIQAVARVVMEVESGVPAPYTQRALDVAGDICQNHALVRAELGKLWKQLLPGEREAATQAAVRGVSSLSDEQRAQLITRGLLVLSGNDQPHLFAGLFAQYARRQGLAHHTAPQGVWIDVDAGAVHVNGQSVEPLTDLEYRLLLLLYGRADKICDKYQIVESVWGQDYLGEVDDARIEKLISRLRAKLEPDPANPQFVVTMRGRGYKLDQFGQMAE